MPGQILIIEDNASNLELMTYLLHAFGHNPLTARSGEEGLEIVRREKIQLILCDIGMAGMDGYEVARYLKSDPTLMSIPLVAITALAMVGDRERILATGFDGYMAKPIEPETFVSQVSSFLTDTTTLQSTTETFGVGVPAKSGHDPDRLIGKSDATP